MRQPAAIVEIDHRVPQPGPAEQHCLGRLVSLHRSVEVEVVARQVREQRHVEVHAVDATLRESDRRHFHRQRLRAGVEQVAHFPLQRHRVGGRQFAGLQRPGKADADRADDRTATSFTRQHLRDPLAARSLAVGPGHTDRQQLLARPAVVLRRQCAEAVAQARHRRTGIAWAAPSQPSASTSAAAAPRAMASREVAGGRRVLPPGTARKMSPARTSDCRGAGRARRCVGDGGSWRSQVERIAHARRRRG